MTANQDDPISETDIEKLRDTEFPMKTAGRVALLLRSREYWKARAVRIEKRSIVCAGKCSADEDGCVFVDPECPTHGKSST